MTMNKIEDFGNGTVIHLGRETVFGNWVVWRSDHGFHDHSGAQRHDLYCDAEDDFNHRVDFMNEVLGR
jgi:hypothetical protein